MFNTDFANSWINLQAKFTELVKTQADAFNFGDHSHPQINYLQESHSSLFQLLQHLSQNPQKIQEIQSCFIENQKNILQNILSKAPKFSLETDRRFKSDAWQSNPFYSYLYQSYLSIKQQTQNTVHTMETEHPEISHKVGFYINQLLEALSPSNFVMTNPDILEKTFNTQGLNLQEGFEKLAQDLQDTENGFGFRMNPEGAFTLGENIAVTPGDVVFRNDLMELIHYKAQGETVYEVPLLIIPPWINKYYIFDLSPKNSLVRWLVEQGFDVYIISWVNPQKGHKSITFEDYMSQGIMKAEEIIQSVSTQKEINFLGYCLGGILLACYMAYRGESAGKSCASFLATPLDFNKAGELKLFATQEQLEGFSQLMAQTNILEGTILSKIFSLLRSKDMIWNILVNNYLLNNEPKPLDFLFWNQDITNLPADMYQFYVQKFYLENGLCTENAILLKNKSIHLSQIKVETFWLSTKEDHIAPFASTLSGIELIDAPVEFVLGESGHVAGVFNPSSSSKYGFTAEGTYKEGSWWPHWLVWLEKRSGKKTLPPLTPSLYPSPGMYARNL